MERSVYVSLRTDRPAFRMLLIEGVCRIITGRSDVLARRQTRTSKKKFRRDTMSFGIYIAGYIILIVGLAIAASMLHLPQKWIVVGVVCLVGIAIMHGVTATRQRDPSS